MQIKREKPDHWDLMPAEAFNNKNNKQKSLK